VYTTTPLFLDAIRNPPAIAVRVEVWRAGVRVDTYGDAGIPVYAGSIQVDGTKLTRRTLTGLRVDATDEMWNLLSPPGTQLRCFRGFAYSNGGSELIPVGRFVVDSISETYGGDWDGTVDTAPDLMALVARARFVTPRSFTYGTRIRDMIGTLLSDVLGTSTVVATSEATLQSSAVYERDRLDAIDKACQSIGAMAYIAPDGTPMVVDIPPLADAAVWDVDAGASGVLYEAKRSRSNERAYTAVQASGAAVDGPAPFPPQTVYDDNPDSPTYYLGPLGIVPYFMSSELFTDAGQAWRAASARLPLVTANRAEFDLTAECNPALEAWDTIAVHLPRRLRGQTAVTERHLLGQFTVPLTPDGVQSMSTRSSVADLPEES
jgi:hypothetical protein